MGGENLLKPSNTWIFLTDRVNHFPNLIFRPYARVTRNSDYGDNPTKEQSPIRAPKGYLQLVILRDVSISKLIFNNEESSLIYNDS